MLGYTENTGIYCFYSYLDLYWDTAVFSNPYWDILDLTKAITKLEEDLKKLQ